jgi:hypothetical protein
MKAIAIAPIEEASLCIVSSFGCKIDAQILHVSCFNSVPSQAKNGVVSGFVGFVGSRAKKRLHQLATNRNVVLAARKTALVT